MPRLVYYKFQRQLPQMKTICFLNFSKFAWKIESNFVNHSVALMFIRVVLFTEESTKIWEWPKEQSIASQLWWILTWPISFFLYISTPDCRKYPRLFPLTFFMCIIWIGIISYLISWLITVIGMF